MTHPNPNHPLKIPLAGILAWVLPGLGHVYLGRRGHGLIHLVVIGATFWGGVALGGVQNTVKPTERTAWFMAQLSTGSFALAAYGWSRAQDDDTPAYTRAAEDVAIVYTGVAGLLNLLVILDALVRAELSPPGRSGDRGGTGLERRDMSGWMLALFESPVELNGLQRLALLLPICLSISIVYKTTRCDSLREVPKAALALWATLLAGMIGVGVFMWLAYLLLA